MGLQPVDDGVHVIQIGFVENINLGREGVGFYAHDAVQFGAADSRDSEHIFACQRAGSQERAAGVAGGKPCHQFGVGYAGTGLVLRHKIISGLVNRTQYGYKDKDYYASEHNSAVGCVIFFGHGFPESCLGGGRQCGQQDGEQSGHDGHGYQSIGCGGSSCGDGSGQDAALGLRPAIDASGVVVGDEFYPGGRVGAVFHD